MFCANGAEHDRPKVTVLDSPLVGELTEQLTYPALLLLDAHMGPQSMTKYLFLRIFKTLYFHGM